MEVLRHFCVIELSKFPQRMATQFRIVLRFPRREVMGIALDIGDELLAMSRESKVVEILHEHAIKAGAELLGSMETWIRIAKDELRFEEILKIRDIEQRMVALKRYGVEKILHDAKAKLVEKSRRGNELYVIPKETGLFTVDAFYLKYQCPSTGRLYISGVPPQMGETKSADACMAWKHGLSVEAYKMLNQEA